jgi:hypothetical protein
MTSYLPFLEFIGGVTIICIVIALIVIGFEFLRDYIIRKKMKYQYKHRFDKLPTAECYCIDCRHFNKCSGECYLHTGWRVAEKWFCWAAEPKK